MLSINTYRTIESWPGISSEVRRVLSRALSTRGKYKGFLKANAPSPSKDPEGNLAWNLIQSFNAPSRVSIGALLLRGQDGLREEILEALESACLVLSGLEVDGIRLPLGAAIRIMEPDYRWNMYAHGKDLDNARLRIQDALPFGVEK